MNLQILTFILGFLILSCVDSYYIKIRDKTFPFELKDTSAANELKERLPFTVRMTKLNNNEVYYRFSEKFTTNTKAVGTINIGDIYLYQDDFLVLFYKTFTTSYSYSEIGHLTDTNGLAEAIGDGSNIDVEWYLNNNDELSSQTNSNSQTDSNISKDSTSPTNSNSTTDSNISKDSTSPTNPNTGSTIAISTETETDSDEEINEITKRNNNDYYYKFKYFIYIFLIIFII